MILLTTNINYFADYTDLMQQYLENKEQCMDTFMLFRIGNFYECFFEDAIMLSKLLGLHLTKRSSHGGAPMCGIPHLQKDKYVEKIVEEGYKVSICEQMEDPALVIDKNLVKREIIQIVTPGTIISQEDFDEGEHNYMACVSKPHSTFGIAVCDSATGDFIVMEIEDDPNRLISELSAYNPSEIVVDSTIKNYRGLVKSIRQNLNLVVSQLPDSSMYANFLDMYDVELPESSTYTVKHTAGMLYHYMLKTRKESISFVKKIERHEPSFHMLLDTNTRKHLELVQSLNGTKTGSLLWAIDYTQTAMGSRLLREFICKPIIDRFRIEGRLDVVQYLVEHPDKRMEIRNLLAGVHDLERIVGRISYDAANARDLIKIADTLEVVPILKNMLEECYYVQLAEELSHNMHDMTEIVSEIRRAIVSSPPVAVKEGGIIRDGYDEKLDEYRKVVREGSSWIVDYQEQLREKMQIKNLKIVYNQSLGYYIEVPRSAAASMPKNGFEKMQELMGKTRFRSEELSRREVILREAESNMAQLEYEIFVKIRESVLDKVSEIKETARCIAILDVLCGFAECAVKNGYVRPKISEDKYELEIKDGRHPVVEKGLLKIEYTSNDTKFSDQERMMLITGPNMAGKSTYMRQVAIICLMAHIGSFVPATKCVVPITDSIFTRIGASDNLYGGESTFMMEMRDIRNITDQATDRSLVIIDELGRGTSVQDGTAIATAVIEHLHDKVKCKTIISTHYLELANLAERLPHMVNYHMLVDDSGDGIEFLHKLNRGVAKSSFGIYCAQLAGIQRSIIDRAYEISQSANWQNAVPVREPIISSPASTNPAPDCNAPHVDQRQAEEPNEDYMEIVQQIADVDVSNMTPIEALVYLDKLRKRSKELIKTKK